MLKLSGSDRKELREAIVSAYPSPGDLEIFVAENLEHNLAAICSGRNLTQTAFDLIKWAEAKGHLDQLVIALYQDTKNPNVQKFWERIKNGLQQHFLLNPSLSASTSALLKLDWDAEFSDEELQGFLPKQFTFEADVGQLRRGLELADSVCKITFCDRPDECGTGVLIAPNLVLTNYHVLSRDESSDLNAIARSARFQFGYVSSTAGEAVPMQTFTVEPNHPIVHVSPIDRLDYALVRLSAVPVNPVPFDAEKPLVPRSPLNILQHPDGEMMKVSLSNNGVVRSDSARGLAIYVNRTKGGSSGSPCFNEDWKLVALHHKEKQTSFGSVREGVLFQAIHAEISQFI